MLNDTYRCRVCGLIQKDPPWGLDGQTPNFDICNCCGVEFGYGDCTLNAVKSFREKWINSGASWDCPEAKPSHWSLEEQIKNIPKDFK